MQTSTIVHTCVGTNTVLLTVLLLQSRPVPRPLHMCVSKESPLVTTLLPSCLWCSTGRPKSTGVLEPSRLPHIGTPRHQHVHTGVCPRLLTITPVFEQAHRRMPHHWRVCTVPSVLQGIDHLRGWPYGDGGSRVRNRYRQDKIGRATRRLILQHSHQRRHVGTAAPTKTYCHQHCSYSQQCWWSLWSKWEERKVNTAEHWKNQERY